MGTTNRQMGFIQRVKQIFKPKPIQSIPLGKAYGRKEVGSINHRSSFHASPKRKGKTRGSVSRMKMNHV